MPAEKMKKELYVANNIEDLNKLTHKEFKTFKPEKLYKSADLLYREGVQNLNKGDEEMSYIYFVRFILLYEYLKTIKNDGGYTKKRLGSAFNAISEQLEALKISLDERYNQRKNTDEFQNQQVVEEPKFQPQQTVTINFPSGFVTCTELFRLIQNKTELVILDARLSEDYRHSSMKQFYCVNIPEEVIHSGLSANVLGKQIPSESVHQFNRRWKVSLLILLDWSSTKNTVAGSKLSILQDILINWDTAAVSDNIPVILSGGYLEWLQTYPMCCTNPDVVHEVQNSVLNDLLDLDAINYPTTEVSTPARYLKPPPAQPVINRATKPMSVIRNQFTPEILNNEKEVTSKPSEFDNTKNMNNEKCLPEDSVLQNNNINTVNINNQKEDVDKLSRNVKDLDLEKKTKERKNDLRDRLLQEAREKKNAFKALATIKARKNVKHHPTFDRSRKPIKGIVSDPGLTGLRNFGTTCYINSVVQCLSNTPSILAYFYNSTYLSEINESKDTRCLIVTVFGNLIQLLWSGQYKTFVPKSLKAAINEYGPRYRNLEHQDAHEFLIALTNWIHEDLKRDIDRPIQVCWTPKENSWIEQTDGKYSIILATFCGQLKSSICCDNCRKRKEKYEIFENLTLALPSTEHCSLEYCLDKYFSKQPISGYRCPKCNQENEIFQQFGIVSHPPVLVMILKRFVESNMNNGSFERNNIQVKYPLKNLTMFNKEYSLHAVVNHYGNLDMGHYWAVCKSPRNHRWYKYDDEIVTEVDETAALCPSEAYMLFYSSVEEQAKIRWVDL